MPWKECHVMVERLRFVARLLEGEKMAPLCAAFGISRKTGASASGSSPSCSTISTILTTRPVASNRSRIRSARKCYLCPRNKLSPMCPERTGSVESGQRDLTRPARSAGDRRSRSSGARPRSGRSSTRDPLNPIIGLRHFVVACPRRSSAEISDFARSTTLNYPSSDPTSDTHLLPGNTSAAQQHSVRVFSDGDLPETRSQALAPIAFRPIPIHTTGARLASNDFFCVLRENVPLRTLILRDPAASQDREEPGLGGGWGRRTPARAAASKPFCTRAHSILSSSIPRRKGKSG